MCNCKAQCKILILDLKYHLGYHMKKRVLFYKKQLMIPQHSTLISKQLQDMYSSTKGGHLGCFRTYKEISKVPYWDGQKNDVQNFVTTYGVCQCNKYKTLRPVSLL